MLARAWSAPSTRSSSIPGEPRRAARGRRTADRPGILRRRAGAAARADAGPRSGAAWSRRWSTAAGDLARVLGQGRRGRVRKLLDVDGQRLCVVRIGDDLRHRRHVLARRLLARFEGDVWEDDLEIECPSTGPRSARDRRACDPARHAAGACLRRQDRRGRRGGDERGARCGSRLRVADGQEILRASTWRSPRARSTP